MGQLQKRDVKHTHSLFVDDLKVYQGSHKTSKDVNKMNVQASNALKSSLRGKMVKGESFHMLNKD